MYLARRAVYAVPILLATTLISYLVAVTAGNHFWDVAQQLANEHYQLTPDQLIQLENYYHLNQPVFEGYFLWVTALLRGDLGVSVGGQQVASVVLPWILPTLELQIPAICTSMVLGTLIGVYSASRRGTKTDSVVTTSSTIAVALPAFWVSVIAIIVVSLWLHILPGGGVVSGYPPYWWGSIWADQVAHWLLPFLVLVLVSTPVYVRIARSGALEALSQEWVTAIRVSGLSERTVLFRYVLRSSLGPALAVVAVNLSVFLAASPGLEVAFGWPGLGLGLVNAARSFDQPVEIAIVLLMTVVTLAVSIIADVAHAFVDPRVNLV
jgi:peptide/nickel transport system permease protein